METDIHKLALDTLNNRKDENAESNDSCFVVNEAGQRLRQCGVNAIPVLERVIVESVVPAMDEYREQHGIPDWDSMFREGTPFAGLSELIGGYWIICARSDPSRAVEFMNKMTRPVVNEAVSLLSVYFHPSNSLSDVPIPREYVEFVNQLSESDVEEFRDVGRYVINRLELNKSATN